LLVRTEVLAVEVCGLITEVHGTSPVFSREKLLGLGPTGRHTCGSGVVACLEACDPGGGAGSAAQAALEACDALLERDGFAEAEQLLEQGARRLQADPLLVRVEQLVESRYSVRCAASELSEGDADQLVPDGSELLLETGILEPSVDGAR
jgi:hypothetical protein